MIPASSPSATGVLSARAPLRIPLGGGGTDLPSHYTRNGGFVISAAIDRHVHMLLSTAFVDRYTLKHLDWERVREPAEIEHPILRAATVRHWTGGPYELASVADVPAGTGLGSSGACACASEAAITQSVKHRIVTGRSTKMSKTRCRSEANRLRGRDAPLRGETGERRQLELDQRHEELDRGAPRA